MHYDHSYTATSNSLYYYIIHQNMHREILRLCRMKVYRTIKCKKEIFNVKFLDFESSIESSIEFRKLNKNDDMYLIYFACFSLLCYIKNIKFIYSILI